MKNNAELGVIIPVYNGEKYLRNAVLSVLNQPHKNLVVVIVNDGSKDRSLQIANELKAEDDRVFVIDQDNKGVSCARNAGIGFCLKAKVRYIAFLDADDFWCPNVIDKETVGLLCENGADVVGFSMYACNSAATRFSVCNRYEQRQLNYTKRYQTEFLWAQGSFGTHFYDAALIERYSLFFDPLCKQNEDVIFAAKALFCSKNILLQDRFLYVYRENEASATHSHRYNPRNATNIPDSWEYAAGWFDEHNGVTDEEKSAWTRFCNTTAAARCLEMIRVLAKEGYSYADVLGCFKEKTYYVGICDLNIDDLAEWQKNDLRIFRDDPYQFWKSARRGRFMNIVRNKTCALKIVQKIRNKRKFPILSV